MRQHYHPPLDEITVEGLLYALSDPVRVGLMAQIRSSDSPQSCCSLAGLAGADLPKSTLSQHFKVLREAGLIRSERKGVALQNSPRCEELRPRFGSMIDAILHAYAAQNDKNK